MAECGITQEINGRVWVCVAEPHDSPRQRSSKRDQRGNWPRHMRHYFRVKYPYRGEA